MAERPASIAEAFILNAGRTPDKLCLRSFPGQEAQVVDVKTPQGTGVNPKPRQVGFVEALPRNALGKVLKHRVREELIESEE